MKKYDTIESKLVEAKMKSGRHPGTDWQEKSTAIDGLSIEIYFQLQDGSNFHDVHTAQFKFPDIARKYEDEVSTAEVIGHEQELVDYYKQITATARFHKIAFTEISHLFWIRLRFHDADGKEPLGFPYYDSLDEVIKFQKWVEQKNEETIFLDQDQGWALEARHKEGSVYLMQYDPDEDRYSVNNFIAHESLNSELILSVERARSIIKTLAESIGSDVWSTYRGYPWDDLKL